MIDIDIRIWSETVAAEEDTIGKCTLELVPGARCNVGDGIKMTQMYPELFEGTL
jgi:hypothetical protein